MKHFDRSRFQKAFEKPPQAFHHTVEQALSHIEPARRHLPSRRLAIALAIMAVCLIGVAVAAIHGTAIDDFLNINLKERGVPVTNQFTLKGDMNLVDVTVKEATSDGMSMYLTVEYSLKDAEESAIVFGYDMEYVMNPIRAEQVLPNHLSVPEAKKAKTLYWLTTDGFFCKDDQGEDQDSWCTENLYESPSKVVVMYWFDLRVEDSFDSFIEVESSGYPESLVISIAPKLYVYEEKVNAAPPDNPDSYVSMDEFTQVEAAELQITVSPQRSAVQKKYNISNFPEQVTGLRTVGATVIETPLLYCVRLDFKWLDTPLPDYMIFADLVDEQGENMAYLYGG